MLCDSPCLVPVSVCHFFLAPLCLPLCLGSLDAWRLQAMLKTEAGTMLAWYNTYIANYPVMNWIAFVFCKRWTNACCDICPYEARRWLQHDAPTQQYMLAWPPGGYRERQQNTYTTYAWLNYHIVIGHVLWLLVIVAVSCFMCAAFALILFLFVPLLVIWVWHLLICFHP